MRKVQTVINSAARFVLKMGRRTSTRRLMTGCRQDIWELSRYHTMTTLWKIVRTGKPALLAALLIRYDEGNLSTRKPRLKTVGGSFRWRASLIWNQTPGYTREHTHLKKCLNLGIAQKGGGVLGLPKLLGALFY